MDNSGLSDFNYRSFYNELRYPSEQRSLWLTLSILGLVMLLFSIFSFGTALLVVVLGLWSISFLVRINHSRHVGNALRVGKKQFPELAEQISQAAQIVRVPPVQVFVYQEDRINAYAFGWDVPQAIVLTSSAVESLENDELRFVIGHEMGHIALGHTRLSTLVGGLMGAPNIPILSSLILPIFLCWSRAAEYSADRAGLIACGDLNKSISALIKLLVGPKLAEKVMIDDLICQSQELNHKVDRIGEAGVMHPYLVHRVHELRAFWNLPECKKLLDLAHNPDL